jgi:hypothetical protein
VWKAAKPETQKISKRCFWRQTALLTAFHFFLSSTDLMLDATCVASTAEPSSVK